MTLFHSRKKGIYDLGLGAGEGLFCFAFKELFGDGFHQTVILIRCQPFADIAGSGLFNNDEVK